MQRLRRTNEHDLARKGRNREVGHESDADAGCDQFEVHREIHRLRDDARAEARQAACALGHLEAGDVGRLG